MKRSWNHLWLFYITIQQFFHHGQAKTIKNNVSDPLKMDEAYLTISNKNYSNPVLFMYNVIVCEHCDFDQLGDVLLMNSSQTLTIDTRYPYDFQVLSDAKNKKTLLCQIDS